MLRIFIGGCSFMHRGLICLVQAGGLQVLSPFMEQVINKKAA
jgi:hypothetical protein